MAEFVVVCFCYRKGGNLPGVSENGMVESGEYIKHTTGASLVTHVSLLLFDLHAVRIKPVYERLCKVKLKSEMLEI